MFKEITFISGEKNNLTKKVKVILSKAISFGKKGAQELKLGWWAHMAKMASVFYFSFRSSLCLIPLVEA